MDDKGLATERVVRDPGHHSRQAGRDARAVLNRTGRGARALPRGARDVDGRDHPVIHPGQGAEPRPQLPPPGAGWASTTGWASIAS